MTIDLQTRQRRSDLGLGRGATTGRLDVALMLMLIIGITMLWTSCVYTPSRARSRGAGASPERAGRPPLSRPSSDVLQHVPQTAGAPTADAENERKHHDR